jgi:serine/threonine protein kinase
MTSQGERHTSWKFKDGEEIVPGRMAVELLGGGIRAEAWLAWDTSLHTTVVVKLLRPDFTDNERARKAIAREARTLKRLQHPAIVRMFDSTLNGPRPHLVLESLDGPRISTLLHTFGALTPEQLVPLGLELSSALAYMHNQSFVHLDVKPRNIIMSAMPRLIDLGMARTRQEIRDLTHPVGTDEYMAPEQCSGSTIKTAGPPADVWGLGVTLYQSVSLRRPFPGGTDETPYPQVDSEPAPLDRRIPSAVARIIMSCLEREPDARPTALDLAAELEGLVEEARLVAGRRLRARFRR